ICAFTEEREKKTLESTLLIPVKTEVLVAGKFLCVMAVALVSGVLNFFGMGLVAALALSQAKVVSGFGRMSRLIELLPPETLLCLTVATLLFAGLISACFALLSALTRSFKEAQNILTVPLLIVSPIPLFGLLPGISLNTALSLIPILNLVLWVKSAVRGDAELLPVFITVFESGFLIAAMLFMLNSLVRTESFALGHQQILRFAARGKVS
ncbi:MAG TPA: ABC transporter permease, partial [Candidatus Obscuribacterales bacterium]